MFSGNQGTGIKNYTLDVSGANYCNGSPSSGSNNGRIFVRYESGTSYTQDPQLTKVQINGSNYSVGDTGHAFSYGNWQTTYRTTNTAYSTSGFSNVTAGTSPTGKWFRDTGNTPSGGTGVNVSSCIYYEGSSGGYSKDVYLQSPIFAFSSDTVKLSFYAYGSSIGSMWFGVYITS